MSIFKIKQEILETHGMKTHALVFIPEDKVNISAIFTHGYTSHKASILTWATRLAEKGISVVLFDLPGHFLGHFNDVPNFKVFQDHAHKLFFEASKLVPNEKCIIGGHSLGALLSLRANQLIPDILATVAVGFGLSISDEKTHHIFETPFYRKTIELRGQLVSKSLSPETVFSWIKNEKENLKISNQKIHLITGKDDVVVPEKNVLGLKSILDKQGNEVSLDLPKRLPHNNPELAGTSIMKFLRESFDIR